MAELVRREEIGSVKKRNKGKKIGIEGMSKPKGRKE